MDGARRSGSRARSSSIHALQHGGALAEDAGPVDIDRAAVRRAGRDVSLITYGGDARQELQAAETLARDGTEAEVIDLRTLRPLDMATILASVKKTHRAVIVDEGWKSGSLSAEISARLERSTFYELDAPVGAGLQRRGSHSVPEAP